MGTPAGGMKSVERLRVPRQPRGRLRTRQVTPRPDATAPPRDPRPEARLLKRLPGNRRAGSPACRAAAVVVTGTVTATGPARAPAPRTRASPPLASVPARLHHEVDVQGGPRAG